MNQLNQLQSEAGTFVSYMPMVEEICLGSDNPKKLFSVLTLSPILKHACREIVEHHMGELARRLERGEDLTLGTKAEVLCSLLASEVGLPKLTDDDALIHILFDQVMGEPLKERRPRSNRGELTFDIERAYRLRRQLYEARVETRDPCRQLGENLGDGSL